MDIEILIDYIQKKGFEVWVYPGKLIFRKVVEGQICSYSWAISKVDLREAPRWMLFQMADKCMHQVDQAIQERVG